MVRFEVILIVPPEVDHLEDWIDHVTDERVGDVYEQAGMDREYGEAVARALRSEARGEAGPPVD